MTSKNEKIQNRINELITETRAKGWKASKTTKKAIARIEELGLSEYVPAWMLRHGEKADIYLAAIIEDAEKVGGTKTTMSSWNIDGDADAVTLTEGEGVLHALLNSDETPCEPFYIIISTISDSTNTIPTGYVEIESLSAFADKYDCEIEGNRIICEWGNGEGYDEFEFEIA